MNSDNHNKIPHSMNGDHHWSWFSHPHVWTGLFASGQGQVWPSQQRWAKRWSTLREAAQYEWGKGYLVEKTLRGVGPMENRFTCVKGGQGNHFFLWFVLLFSLSIQTIMHSLLFSKNCWGNSCLGFLLLLERPLEGFFFILHISWLKAKASSSKATLLLQQHNFVL